MKYLVLTCCCLLIFIWLQLNHSHSDFNFFCSSLLTWMPRRTHQPRLYQCNKRTTRTCRIGFSSLSGLTRHQNKMHPLPNNQLLPALLPPPEFSPPPDDMYFNDGENNPPPDDMYFDEGENNPRPHEAIEGDVQTLRHPILNGMSFTIHTFFVLYPRHASRHAM